MTPKKIIERRYFDVFRQAMSDSLPGEVCESENPDFLIRLSDQPTIGVEVTTIFERIPNYPDALKHQDAEHIQVLQEAQKGATKLGIPPMMVDVVFEKNSTISKMRRNAIAQYLVQNVSSRLPEIGVDQMTGFTFSLPDRTYVKSVTIRRHQLLKRHLWHVGIGTQVIENFSPLLQGEIDRKAISYKHYLDQCSECWLLVVATCEGSSAWFEISDEMAASTYHTPFDRAYFLSAFSGRVTRLVTAKSQ